MPHFPCSLQFSPRIPPPIHHRMSLFVSSIQVLTTSPLVESWGHFPRARRRLISLLRDTAPAGALIISGDVHYAELIGTREAGGEGGGRGGGAPGATDATDATDAMGATDAIGALTSGVSGSQRALGAAALLEVTSSGLTHACGEGGYFKYLCKPLLAIFSAHRLRHGAYLSSRNFGTVELRHPGAGGARGGSLLVQLHRIDGSVALRHSLPLGLGGEVEAARWQSALERSPTIFQAARPVGLILIVLISTLLLVAVRRRHHRKVARGPTVQTRQLGGGRQRRRKVE